MSTSSDNLPGSSASSFAELSHHSITFIGNDALVRPEASSGLTWNNIHYRVPTKPKGFGKRATESRTLLNNISGAVAPGEMVAIMGSSGAGKSTLLNALAGRLQTGTLSGQVLYKGVKRDPRLFKKQVAYVEQDDLLYPELTVKETIQYAATMKLPSRDFSAESKARRVNDVIEWLRLTETTDTMIGDSMARGVSGGERKRTAIGVELVTDPGFLFLDEATSGLDSNSALHVCEVVKSLCRARHIGVLMTIHQPSAKIFNLFDKVILLCKGDVVYAGPVAESVDYFARLGYVCAQHENPADFFLDLITLDHTNSERLAKSQARIDSLISSFQLKANQDSKPILTILPNPKEKPESTKPPLMTVVSAGWALPWLRELAVLLDRTWKAQTRSHFRIIAMAIRPLITGLFMGFTFFQLETTQSSIQNRVGFLFFIPIDLAFGVVVPMLTTFTLQADIMTRERSGGAYRVSSFYLAKFLTELPFWLLFNAVYLTVIYFLAHLQYDAIKFFTYLGICLMHVVVSVSLGLAIGSVFRNVHVSQMLAPLFINIFLVFSGNLVNFDDITPVLSWIRYISFITYTYQALSRNEFTGLHFSCDNPATESAVGCVLTGEDVLTKYSLDSFSIGTCIGLLGALTVAFHLITYICLRWKAKPRYLWI
ncbi:P-loop containing nucleoside triphosphate hydrolase protein [Dimargaris cristalligena]|uniref:P-loop containing nucleoside triphosphate hydrolase protein n=1 Tax=Dimargaris cristalligena TaxID=215637 RepID=A0A4P9ZT49_9FUNG|nr:P-loop containing nucleoside triphosphate hydrolase protein [Dimargaris cristalligena]|eukprot:RKP36647.1 P-loop containing nucleoside triphosphate hydrolase protein [Dimargaris cristalligena]